MYAFIKRYFFIGMVQVAYIPLQFNIWWVTHTLVLYWALGHPFEAKQFDTEKCFRRAHIIITFTGILVPIIPIVAVVVHDAVTSQEYGTLGFGLIMSPPHFCTTPSSDSFFYFIMLPNAFLTLIGVTGLALTIWTIHRVSSNI